MAMAKRKKRLRHENLAGWRLAGGKLLLITAHGEEEFDLAPIGFTEVTTRFREVPYIFELGTTYTIQKQPPAQPDLHYTVYRMVRRLSTNIMHARFRGIRRPLPRVDIFMRVAGEKVLLRALRNGLLVVKYDNGEYIFTSSPNYVYLQRRPPYARLPEGLAEQLSLLARYLWERLDEEEIDSEMVDQIMIRITRGRGKHHPFNRKLREQLSGTPLFPRLPTSRDPDQRVMAATRRHRKR
jgi:hypothetical protein